jgi:hypothetical protein
MFPYLSSWALPSAVGLYLLSSTFSKQLEPQLHLPNLSIQLQRYRCATQQNHHSATSAKHTIITTLIPLSSAKIINALVRLQQHYGAISLILQDNIP